MFKKLIGLLSGKCPDCNGELHNKMLDMRFDKMVYQCKNCKKLWI